MLDNISCFALGDAMDIEVGYNHFQTRAIITRVGESRQESSGDEATTKRRRSADEAPTKRRRSDDGTNVSLNHRDRRLTATMDKLWDGLVNVLDSNPLAISDPSKQRRDIPS
jgi:hypothetical protein